MKRKVALALLFGLFWVSGPGCVSGESVPASPAVKSVTITCSPTSITAAQTSTCSATVSGTGSYSSLVHWTAAGGTISSDGVFVPTGSGKAIITAVSAQTGYGNVSGSALVAVIPVAKTADYWEKVDLWMKFGAVLVAGLALLVTWRVHAQRAFFEMIDELYALPHALEGVLLKEWHLGHLWCIGVDEYNITKSRIQVKVAEEPQRCPEWLVKEKLFAIQIFLVFEQLYYQRTNSGWSHQGRKDFLDQMLSFFHDRLFLNPRLYAILQADPIGDSLHLERRTRKFIEEKMAHIEKPIERDDDGPFNSGSMEKS